MMQRTYKIGEVARLTDLKPFVLRYWESEFPQLAPIRTGKGQRAYTDEHLRLIGKIKALLYGEGLTIDGARKRLADAGRDQSVIKDVYDELVAIRRLLGGEKERNNGEKEA